MGRKSIRLVLVVLLLGLGGIAYFGTSVPFASPSQTVEYPELGIQQGKKFLNLSVTTLPGQNLPIQSNGQMLIINFWATWCPPCRNEMPELNTFVRQHPEVAFYGVNLQESKEKVEEYMQQNQYTMPVYLDKDGEAAKAYQIRAIPTTLVVDSQGIIQYRKSGAVTKAELEAILKGLH